MCDGRHHYTAASNLMYESFVSDAYLRYPALFSFRVQPGAPLCLKSAAPSTPEAVIHKAMRVAFLPDGALIQSVKALNPQAMGSASKVMHILLDEDMKLLQACCKPSSYEICVSKKTIRLPCYL